MVINLLIVFFVLLYGIICFYAVFYGVEYEKRINNMLVEKDALTIGPVMDMYEMSDDCRLLIVEMHVAGIKRKDCITVNLDNMNQLTVSRCAPLLESIQHDQRHYLVSESKPTFTRTIDLPTPVLSPEQVTTDLEDGLLRITIRRRFPIEIK
jgi:HSP20 family molecular chaperone IbpA